MTDEINNACRTLELEPGASLSQVEKARREMTTAWHPDRFPSGSELQRKAREQTEAILVAYEVLKRHLTSGETAASTRLGAAEEKSPPKTENAKKTAKSSSTDSGRRRENSSRRRRQSSRRSRGRKHRKSRRRKKRTAKEWLLLALFASCGVVGLIIGAQIGLTIGTRTAKEVESWDIDPSREISSFTGELHDLFDIAGLVIGGGIGWIIGWISTKRIVRFIAKVKRKKYRAARIAAAKQRRRRRKAAAANQADPTNEPNQSPSANNQRNQERKVVHSRSVSSRARIRSHRTKGK